MKSSVIRQKGESQDEGNKKTKLKTHISYALIRTRTCAYQGGKKCSFVVKSGLLCFPHFLIPLLPH